MSLTKSGFINFCAFSHGGMSTVFVKSLIYDGKIQIILDWKILRTYISKLIKNEQIENKNGSHIGWKTSRIALRQSPVTKKVSSCHIHGQTWIIYIIIRN